MDVPFKTIHKLFKTTFGKHMKKTIFVQSMRFVVNFLNICPLYVVNFEMIEYMDN
jgi:hypothetical protein